MFTHRLESAHGLYNLSFVVKNGVLKVTGSHVHIKSGSVLKTVLDKKTLKQQSTHMK